MYNNGFLLYNIVEMIVFHTYSSVYIIRILSYKSRPIHKQKIYNIMIVLILYFIVYTIRVHK